MVKQKYPIECNLPHIEVKSFEPFGDYAEKLVQMKARQLSRKRGFTPEDREDIAQDLRLHLWLKLKNFDRKRAGESTFISRILDNKFASMIRERRALKRRAPAMPAATAESSDDSDSIFDTLPSKTVDIELPAQIAEVIASLPTLLRRAAKLLMYFGPSDTAEFLDINRCSFTTWLLPKLENAFRNAGFESTFAETRNMLYSDCVSIKHAPFKEELRDAPLNDGTKS